jgi:hypothetical protein
LASELRLIVGCPAALRRAPTHIGPEFLSDAWFVRREVFSVSVCQHLDHVHACIDLLSVIAGIALDAWIFSLGEIRTYERWRTEFREGAA